MLPELWIQGYKNKNTKSFLKKCGFSLEGIKPDEHLVVFAGYSEYEIPIGEKLEWFHCKDNKLICITVKIHAINLGFGPLVTSIPKGFKSILLLTGRDCWIQELKENLVSIKEWHDKNAVPIKAFDIGKNSGGPLGIDFNYASGDPFW